MLNVVAVVGRLTADPELRVTTTGKNVCSFTVAVQKDFKPTNGDPDADFFNVVAWGPTADFVANYVTKGRLVSVAGRLQSRKFTTNEGAQRHVVEIVAQNVQALERPRDDAEPAAAAQRSVRQKAASGPAVDEYDPFADE